MADILSTLATGYTTVPAISSSKYVDVDPKVFSGAWEGTYSTNEKFRVEISDVSGFRAKVKYQSGATIKYQDVLIRDNGFRVGDSKFTVTRVGHAQIKTVATDPATGSSVLNTAYASKKS